MLRVALRQHVQSIAQEIGGDVDRDVLSRRQPAEQTLGLLAIARAQVDQYTAGADTRRDLVHVGIDDRALGARQRVLRQLANRLEKTRSERIVEIFRRYRRARFEQHGG